MTEKEQNLESKKADTDLLSMGCGKEKIRISVRGLVEFMLRQGDLDHRKHGSNENAMQEGSRIHRMIQRRMGDEYKAEVTMSYTHLTESYVLLIEGRADGVFEENGEITIDEIKGTYREIHKLKEPVALHLAQAKCYAYIYALHHELRSIRVRMTYCNIETEAMRYFYEDFTFEVLEKWFQTLVKAYQKWADYIYNWKKIRQKSMEGLEFPFPYRKGQKELITYVYQTIYHKRNLFLEAPTGVGKTISTIFPAIKSIERGMGEKIFYLTAKTITRTVAEETFSLLRRKGLKFKSVILTAKEKSCFLEQVECNPDACPYAKGHFDRINDAMYDLLTREESFTRETIALYAERHRVCPFELCLDISLFADGIIGDYNYLFDPHVYLKRFFTESNAKNYIFLIDEAHNLLERGREMYSATLYKDTFLEIKHEIKKTRLSELKNDYHKISATGQLVLNMTDVTGIVSEPKELSHKKTVLCRKGYAEKLEYHLEQCNRKLLAMKRECEDYRIVDSIDAFVQSVLRLQRILDEYLDEQEDGKLEVREQLMEFFFELSHFLEIYEIIDENYVKYTELLEDGRFLLRLFCVNPKENLRSCMDRGRSSILFSATFLPIQYYKSLLGGQVEDYEVYADSVFSPLKRGLFIANDVTSKYTRRTEEEYVKIAKYIDEIVKNKSGNYMVFCPSYHFLRTIYEIYQENYACEEKECMIQGEHMNENEREMFLNRFRGNDSCEIGTKIAMEIEWEENRTLIGFCVLGGIFSEGIDLTKDSLIGAVIVGTGIPQVCNERKILKNYFDERGESGFDYSYRYPGMNKVMQAAGRVIRTVEDVGIVVLLDERFLQFTYRRMFPKEWESFETVNLDTVGSYVERFWNLWL